MPAHGEVYVAWLGRVVFMAAAQAEKLHGLSLINPCSRAHARAIYAQQIGTAVKGASMRAVEKQGDFLLLEADGEDGDGGDVGGGRLGWVDASCVVPTSFPALYEFAADLPDAVRALVCVYAYMSRV